MLFQFNVQFWLKLPVFLVSFPGEECLGMRLLYANIEGCSLVPRPSITANTVEGLVKLLRRMTSGGRLEAWLIAPCIHNAAVHRKCHASRRPPDIILRRSFTRPSTTLAVIEGLGTRLEG